MNEPATYVIRLTPAGTGAIAVIALAGPRAFPYLQSLLTAPIDLTNLQPSQFRLARLGSPPGEQVVLAGNPEAAEPRLEIHCHGGLAVVEGLVQSLVKQGAVAADERAWLNRTCRSALHAEAVHALGQASTLRTARILLEQEEGACEHAVGEIAKALREGALAEALRQLDALVAWAPLTLHLTKPWRIALAGAPNVGKSTLLNALVGFERALTAPIAGTTRDVVTSTTAFEGWPIELCDTAGVRREAAGLEAAGIARTEALCREADLVVWVLDTQQHPMPAPREFARHTLVVLNKTDLSPCWQLEQVGMTDVPLGVSALGKTHVGELIAAIVDRLVPRIPSPGTAVLPCELCLETIKEARASVQQGDAPKAANLLVQLLNHPLSRIVAVQEP